MPANLPNGSSVRRRSKLRSPYRARRRKGARDRRIRRALAVIFAAIFLYCGIRLIAWRAGVRETTETNAELQAMHLAAMAEPTAAPMEYSSAAQAAAAIPTALPAEAPQPAADAQEINYQYIGENPDGMAELLRKNADLVGWLKISDVVNLPVVYRDNEYYLTHDFYGRKKNSGTLFLDENHPFTARTQHLVIHGHNMYDGNMFGGLPQFRKKSFAENHGVIYFRTLYREEVYLLVAAAITSSDVSDPDFIPFIGTPVFRSEQALRDYIDLLDERGLYHMPLDVDMKDALLTLSTCVDDDRLILFCRRMRDGETQQDVLDQLKR